VIIPREIVVDAKELADCFTIKASQENVVGYVDIVVPIQKTVVDYWQIDNDGEGGNKENEPYRCTIRGLRLCFQC
jgi:hypothetical protein